MSPDHDQKAIDQVHWLRLKPFPVVLTPVTRSDHGNARINDLSQLRLRLYRFCPAETVQALNDQYRAGRDTPLINSLQEDAQGALFYMPLVKGGEAFIPQGKRLV
jgi:hypothetical protein